MALKQGKKIEIENTVRGVYAICKKRGLDPNTWVIKAIKEVAKKKGLQMSKEEIAYAESYLQVIISADVDRTAPADAEVIIDSVGQSGTAAKTEGAEVKIDAPVDSNNGDGVIRIDLGKLNLGKGKVEVNIGKLFDKLNNVPNDRLEEFGKIAGEQLVESLIKPAVSSGFKFLGDVMNDVITSGDSRKKENEHTTKRPMSTFDIIGSMFR